jgi:ribose 1,5-bisphosphokinase PhnN
MNLGALLAAMGPTRALRVPDVARLPGLETIDSVVIVGASGTGKSTLTGVLRAARCGAVEVPRRLVTRAARVDDIAAENQHVSRAEFEQLARAGELGLRWIRRMEGGREEHYGFAPVSPRRLPIYSGNNALFEHPASIEPAGVLAQALFLGVVAPDALRAERLMRRSPEHWRRLPEELAHRLAERAEAVEAHVHLVVENHGELEDAARTETVQLVMHLAAAWGNS